MRAFEHHNLGNDYYKEEEFDKAVEEYNRALELKPDMLETYFNRALAFTRKKEYGLAISDLNKTIELNPKLAEAYYTRGLVYEYKNDNERALEDYERALSCDPGYEKASKQKILAYVRAIRIVAEDDKFLKWLKDNGSGDDELISRVRRETGDMLNSIERPSCDIGCGSLCCYFKDEPWQNSVLIEPGEIETVKKFLLENEKNPDDFIGRVEWEEYVKLDEKSRGEKKDYVVEEAGKKYVYYPKTDSERKLQQEYAGKAPKTLNNDGVEWITPESHPCRFVSDEGCAVHLLGGGFNVCREWVCLTGYVMLLLRLLGALKHDDIQGRDIGDLNGVAEASLPLLYERIYGDRALTDLRRGRESAVRAIVENGNRQEDIEMYNGVDGQYRAELEKRVAELRERVLELLN